MVALPRGANTVPHEDLQVVVHAQDGRFLGPDIRELTLKRIPGPGCPGQKWLVLLEKCSTSSVSTFSWSIQRFFDAGT